jgi:hypothetical protein
MSNQNLLNRLRSESISNPKNIMSAYLPSHLKHLQHTTLFTSLESALASFRANHIIDEAFVKILVSTMASEYEKACERVPVNTRALEIAETSVGISNYRFDRGYWEIVVPNATIILKDSKSGTILMKQHVANLSIEGSGGGLRKGKRKSESIKRAHTRQVARDSRRNEAEDDSDFEEDDDEDGEWKP